MPVYYATIRLHVDKPDEPKARSVADHLISLIRGYSRSEIPQVDFTSWVLASTTGAHATPTAGSTQPGTQPTPTKSFHMPNLKPRDDMGGLMGSG